MKLFLIALISIFMLLCGPPAAAEHEFRLSVVGNFASSLGYNAGLGPQLDSRHALDKGFFLNTRSNVMLQHKHNAAEGYTYRLYGSLDYDLGDILLIEIGYKLSGYKSTFDDGRTWVKSAHCPVFGLKKYFGDENNFLVGIYYSLRENSSVNNVESLSIRNDYVFDNNYFVFSEYTYVWFDQKYLGGIKRMIGDSISVGFGYVWR